MLSHLKRDETLNDHGIIFQIKGRPNNNGRKFISYRHLNNPMLALEPDEDLMSSYFFSKKVKFFITDETVDLMIREIADQDPWVCMMMFDALTSRTSLKPLISLESCISQLFCCGPSFHS